MHRIGDNIHCESIIVRLENIADIAIYRLKGYFHGVDCIVPIPEYIPEYPNMTSPPSRGLRYGIVSSSSDTSQPSRFQPALGKPGDKGNWYGSVKTCYLDAARKVPAPDLYAYKGIPQSQPLPVIGSHEVIQLRDDVCFDRYSRYGPYGLGYSADDGGTGKGIQQKSDKGFDRIWEETGYIDYRNVDWGEAQGRCYQANKHRFATGNEKVHADLRHSTLSKRHRQALVIRTYTGFKWTQYAILDIRAMVSEVSLRSGGEYDVHLLLHVRDDNYILVSDDVEARQIILDAHVPKEFHSLCTLWSEDQMRRYYPGEFGSNVENIAGADIYTVYRSGHMPLQHFAVHHPEYAHFWNWEMDIRYIGSYYELLSKVGSWAARQSQTMLWERSSMYYIPAFHGSWEDFSRYVEHTMLINRHPPVLGPVSDRLNTFDCSMEDHVPESCKGDRDPSQCGVGEPADFITLNPIFDVEDSRWVFSKDITGYNVSDGGELPARRSTIITASRLSRRLLHIMHKETKDRHRSMFTEMFPPSVALHYGLKAVYAPHPIYLDRAWPISRINRAFNGGKHNTSSGAGSPFDPSNEHNHKGTSYYYHAEFAGSLWRRWLGLNKSEGKGNSEGRSRLCLRSMLIHPVKREG